MNKNIDLTKILKDCPRGVKFYSTLVGEVEVEVSIYGNTVPYPIYIYKTKDDSETPLYKLTKDGRCNIKFSGECALFPSKNQRDWSKFTAPWLKKERFDPKTLKPFDKVLVRDECHDRWYCEFFSFMRDKSCGYPYVGIGSAYEYCIPYNDDTKHLVGTKEEAPDFYRYWED